MPMMVFRKAIPGVLVFASMLASAELVHSSDLAEVKRRGELRMLCFPHDASEFITVRDGEYWGLDHEILRTFAVANGVSLTVVPVPKFADLIPWLLERKGDVIGSSFSITEERKEKVDFSESYFPVRVMIVGKSGEPLSDPSALASMTMAVVPGSSLESFVRKKIPSAELVLVKETPEVYEVVRSGRADFAPVDSTSALTDLDSFPDLETRYVFPDVMGYGFAVTRGSDLAPALSEHIQKLRSSGLLYQQLGRFLGPRAIEMVKTAERGK
jgi:ABC-type amino acid transport substrate-binding protein